MDNREDALPLKVKMEPIRSALVHREDSDLNDGGLDAMRWFRAVHRQLEAIIMEVKIVPGLHPQARRHHHGDEQGAGLHAGSLDDVLAAVEMTPGFVCGDEHCADMAHGTGENCDGLRALA